MFSKALKISLDIVASIVVLVILFFALGYTGGLIFGRDEEGYGNYSAGIFYTIIFALTIVFSVWFYKFLNRKSKTAKK